MNNSHNIPVNIDPIIEPRKNPTPKSEPAGHYWDAKTFKKPFDYNQALLWCIIGSIIGLTISITIFQYKYSALIDQANELATVQEEMQWRTASIKDNLAKNQELLTKYEELSTKFVNDMSDHIKNKKQKVVESN